jgi:phosphoserine phosphatase RsbX
LDLIKGLHDHLKGSRGVVAALCRLDYANNSIEHVGIGNINVRIYGEKHLSIISRDGIIGYSSISPKIQTSEMYRGDILVLSSDGIKEHFSIEEYPGLLYGSSRKIAENFMSNLGKENDDVSCSVLRYKQ